ncbi:MAG: NAD+ synthase [Candidatus Marinimicrobia bacterium]|jgi:NAD+ synthase (glutamine-hydrolysing)|nr:NAD+ synthase [Candidatus Neomarinimicrobiota bacterium]MDP7217596.1 NAD+ synthase [Candidatus Neomarinimicrobiota bacterium]MDP7436333.1 NAD+ synthase [Candidatus Neomarinimicrobiota bacterium]
MKIALCQINPTVGALDANKELILSNYKEAVENGADLVVFPEMVITGYPIADLLYEDGFVDENKKVLGEIADKSTVPLILGYIDKDKEHLFNSAAVCVNGEQVYRYDKLLLPTYDVFDEDRYFSAGTEPGICELQVGGKEVKIGLEICEDLWDEDYDRNISKELHEAGVDCIINISASPYHELRLNERLDLVQSKVQLTNIPFYYCNLVGAQDELIFDGQSIAMSGDGSLVGLGTIFQEEIIYIDTENNSTVEIHQKSREAELYDALVLGVKDYFRKTGHHEAVIGLSGGIDSSLVACIAVDALGAENVHGVSMPSVYSSEHSKDDAHALAENLGIDYRSISIEDAVDQFETTLKPHFSDQEKNVAEENIQARVRGNLLMALSNKHHWLVLSTGNKTELALGYCTLYGDMSGGLAVISDLSKVDVYGVSKWVNKHAGFERIPENCITKPPSAELAPGQVDPFDYDIVSPLVEAIVEERKSPAQLAAEGYEKELVKDLYQKIRVNEYKRRQAAPGLRVTKKAFGTGRRMPIVNHYKGKNS